MRVTKNNLLQQVLAAFATYIILSLAASFICWILIERVYINIKSISEIKRINADADYLSILGLFSLSLSLSMIIYKLVLLMVPTSRRDIVTRCVIGFVTGFLPISLGYLLTWGFPFSSIPNMIIIILCCIAGVLIPIIEPKFLRDPAV